MEHKKKPNFHSRNTDLLKKRTLCQITLKITLQKDNKKNKAITMMRGKSPRFDVQMSKKLNFVAAILDF